MFEKAAAWLVVMLFAVGVWLVAGAVAGPKPTGGSKQ